MERREDFLNNEVTIDTHWVYQNPTTGQPSQHPLTTRQICLLVKTNVLTPETQLLQVLPDHTYATEWQVARTVSIVRCVVEPWYYESIASNTTTQGPISCPQLATLLYQEPPVVRPTTRVYSQLTNEWKCIQDDAELQMALEVFSPTGDRLDPVKTTEAQTELEAFLLSTERIRSSGDIHQGDDASYESDHGTRYVKDYRTGKWIHEALMPTQKEQHAEKEVAAPPKKKKQKKAKFAARNARCWIYIAGLPLDTTEEQLAQIFAKAGILDLDPTTQRPKIKVYRHKDGHPFAGQCKGDASLCYARPESVALAITLLDETEYNGSGHTMRVQPAQFEQRGELDTNRNRISNAQRKVAKLAALQARDWDDSNSSSRLVGGRKGLRIIVLKHLFEPNVWKNEAQEDEFFAELERSLRAELEVFGVVEKITVFSQRAVVVVKLAQPSSASEVVKDWDGKLWKGRRVQAMYWDGVTDYTVRDDEKEQVETEQRLEEFGNWLDEQELPEELKLQKE